MFLNKVLTTTSEEANGKINQNDNLKQFYFFKDDRGIYFKPVKQHTEFFCAYSLLHPVFTGKSKASYFLETYFFCPSHTRPRTEVKEEDRDNVCLKYLFCRLFQVKQCQDVSASVTAPYEL